MAVHTSVGVRWTGMPGWKAEHTAEETWKLVSFMRHVPALTPAEVNSLGHADHDDDDR